MNELKQTNYIEKYFTSGLLLGYRHYNTNMNKSKKIHYIHSFEQLYMSAGVNK